MLRGVGGRGCRRSRRLSVRQVGIGDERIGGEMELEWHWYGIFVFLDPVDLASPYKQPAWRCSSVDKGKERSPHK